MGTPNRLPHPTCRAGIALSIGQVRADASETDTEGLDDAMVGIGIDHISITRRLPIEGSSLGRVLARLQAETSGNQVRWNLGERGSCELDVTFARGQAGATRFVTSARLWDPANTSCATVAVSLATCEGHESQLEIHPAEAIGEWWTVRLPAYLDLAHAALEELAQELLFQHTRVLDDLAG
jgi:hypothetical protein